MNPFSKEMPHGKTAEKPGEKGGHTEDHKAAVSKMNPEHVHKLVKDAHAGKYGPQAQQAAQSAMQPQGDPAAPAAPAAPAGRSMFSSGGGAPAAPTAAAPAGGGSSMFGSGR